MQGWNRIERCLISMTGGISRYLVSVNPPRPSSHGGIEDVSSRNGKQEMLEKPAVTLSGLIYSDGARMGPDLLSVTAGKRRTEKPTGIGSPSVFQPVMGRRLLQHISR